MQRTYSTRVNGYLYAVLQVLCIIVYEIQPRMTDSIQCSLCDERVLGSANL
jgi:hypothetical protein